MVSFSVRNQLLMCRVQHIFNFGLFNFLRIEVGKFARIKLFVLIGGLILIGTILGCGLFKAVQRRKRLRSVTIDSGERFPIVISSNLLDNFDFVPMLFRSSRKKSDERTTVNHKVSLALFNERKLITYSALA